MKSRSQSRAEKIRQISRALGVSVRHVHRLISEGFVDPGLSIRTIKAQVKKTVRKQYGGVKKGYKSAKAALRPAKTGLAAKKDEGPAKGTLAWVTLQREKVKLQKESLDVKRSMNQMVDVDQVRAQAFQDGRILRDQVFNIPDRLSMILAAESDPAKIHSSLSGEISRIFAAFARKKIGEPIEKIEQETPKPVPAEKPEMVSNL